MKRILKIRDWFHPDGFPVSVEKREPQGAFGPHTHEFTELVIVTGGKCLHVSGEDSTELTSGDVLVITGNREHEYREVEQLRLINILYQPDQLKLGLLDLPSVAGYQALFTLEPSQRKPRRKTKRRMRLSSREMAHILETIDRLENELDSRQPGFAFMATAHFMQIIGLLARTYGRNPSPDGGALLRVGEALSYLENNFHNQIDLDELARISNMSRRSFLRVFRSATGISPLAWVLERRITRARNLLRQTDRRITEIAFEVGFNDSNYFTRRFRKSTGMSPRQYRLGRSPL